MNKSTQITSIILFFLLFFGSHTYGIKVSLRDKIPYIRRGVYTDDAFSFDFSGYLSLEGFYDSRQVEGFALDEYVWVPRPVYWDNCCLDVNDASELSMLGVRIYAQSIMYGPKIWGAKSSGFIKCDFVGVDNPTIRNCRLRHGLFLLEWEKTQLKIGHSYHPIVLDPIYPEPEFVVYPNTITRASGAGYDPFAYSPQVRITHNIKDFTAEFALVKFYQSDPPRWSAIPDVFFKIKRHIGKHFFGAGINYSVSVPRIETDKGYKTKEQIGSVFPFVFALFDIHPLLWYFRLSYAENAFPFSIIGAYGVKWRNPQTDERQYVNMRALTFWTELSYRGSKRVQPGVLIGVTKNIGASCPIQKYYTKKEIINDYEVETIVPLLKVDGAITNASYMLIFSPRIRVKCNNFTVGIETEYTRAAFARSYDCPGWENDFDCRGRVIRATPVSNFRFYAATFYDFA